MIRRMMEEKEGGQEGGQGTDADTMIGQYASTIRQERAPDGSMREYVWLNKRNEDLNFDSSDEEWSRDEGSFKIYGNWNEYAQGQDEEGNMFLPDEDFPIKKGESGEWTLDESTFDGQNRGYEAAKKAQGGPGASRTEDLMEMLGGMRGQGGQPAPGRQMGMGGKIYKRGGKFPDLNKDGKITMADILKGRGVRR